MSPMTRRRPFTLLDSLVLLAATAGGFAVTRSLAGLQAIDRMEFVDYRDRGSEDPAGKLTTFKSQYYARGTRLPGWGMCMAYWVQRAAFWPCPCLAAWTLAVLTLTCCTSRMPPRRILRRTGTMAGLAWIVGFSTVAVASPGVLLAARTFPGAAVTVYWRDWWFLTWFDLPRAAGYAVALAWISVALNGRFGADCGWHDRLGTLLGSCWIGLGFLSLLGSWLTMF
jgi:hypothetical protein